MKDWWNGLQPNTRCIAIIAAATVIATAIIVGGPEAVQGLINLFSG